jgi:hypothetical protein
MDEELTYIKRELARLELKLRQDKKMVQACELETGEGLDDDEEDELRSAEDLKDCQEGRVEIPVFQEGNELRLVEDLVDCQEDSQGISHCQLGNGRRSLWDLKDYQEGSGSIEDCQEGRDEHLRPFEGLMESSIQQGVLMKMGSVDLIFCQEGSRSIPYCHVDRDEQMNLDQPGELIEQVNLDQQVQLTEEEEDQNDILMIGGIQVFLPFSQEEVEICVAYGTSTVGEQSVVTVKRKLELMMTIKRKLE